MTAAWSIWKGKPNPGLSVAERISAWAMRKDMMVLRYGRKACAGAVTQSATPLRVAGGESKEVIGLKDMWFGMLGNEANDAKRKRMD